jgi:hypothetical protein
MDIRATLLERHSKYQTSLVVDHIGANRQRFADLMSIIFAGEALLQQRAAWAVSYCVERHPQLVKPYLRRLVTMLKEDVQAAAKRNIARLLQFVEVPRSLQGLVYENCLTLAVSLAEPAAVRCFALTSAARIAGRQPELLHEMKLTLERQLPELGPALRVRVAKELGLPRKHKVRKRSDGFRLH